MGRRVDLHKILVNTLGSRNVYYDPPESKKLSYPCIVYSLEGHYERNADNQSYTLVKRYGMTYITEDSDDPMVDKLEALKFCSLNRPYTAGDLHHFSYTIFY
jgi:hypothetical protein